VELGDGSSLDGLQCVVGDPELAKRMNTGTSVRLTGRLVSSPAKGQKTELKVDSCAIIGECDPAVRVFAGAQRRHVSQLELHFPLDISVGKDKV
jgi:asparaginyl-tRNA synthetase